MNLLGLENLSKVVKVCLRITFVLGLFVTIFLSVILKKYFNWYFGNNTTYYWAYIAILTPCGVCSLNILWQLSCIMDTIHNKNPFIIKNVICLKRIALSSFGIAILFFILLFFQATVLTFVIAYIFLIAGISSLVFGGLFQKAVDYKNENDLTI